MDVGLVGFGLLGGEAAKLGEDARGDANSDELLGVASDGTADAAGATSSPELLAGCFGDIGEVDLAIRDMPRVLYGSRGAR